MSNLDFGRLKPHANDLQLNLLVGFVLRAYVRQAVDVVG